MIKEKCDEFGGVYEPKDNSCILFVNKGNAQLELVEKEGKIWVK